MVVVAVVIVFSSNSNIRNGKSSNNICSSLNQVEPFPMEHVKSAQLTDKL